MCPVARACWPDARWVSQASLRARLAELETQHAALVEQQQAERQMQEKQQQQQRWAQYTDHGSTAGGPSAQPPQPPQPEATNENSGGMEGNTMHSTMRSMQTIENVSQSHRPTDSTVLPRCLFSAFASSTWCRPLPCAARRARPERESEGGWWW